MMKALTIVPLLLLVSHGEELQLFVKPKPEVCLGCAEVFELLNEVIPDVGHVSKGEFKAHIDFACKTLSSKGDHKYKDVCKFVKKNQAYILRHLKKVGKIDDKETCHTFLRCTFDDATTQPPITHPTRPVTDSGRTSRRPWSPTTRGPWRPTTGGPTPKPGPTGEPWTPRPWPTHRPRPTHEPWTPRPWPTHRPRPTHEPWTPRPWPTHRPQPTHEPWTPRPWPTHKPWPTREPWTHRPWPTHRPRPTHEPWTPRPWPTHRPWPTREPRTPRPWSTHEPWRPTTGGPWRPTTGGSTGAPWKTSSRVENSSIPPRHSSRVSSRGWTNPTRSSRRVQSSSPAPKVSTERFSTSRPRPTTSSSFIAKILGF